MQLNKALQRIGSQICKQQMQGHYFEAHFVKEKKKEYEREIEEGIKGRGLNADSLEIYFRKYKDSD